MENLMIIIVAILSGMATYTISNYFKKGTVLASASVTLVSGLIFPYFFPDLGPTLMVVAACCSYAGMVSTKNVTNIGEMAIVSLITGVLFIVFKSAYPGIGGRLGTIAAISCITWIGIKKVFWKSKFTSSKVFSRSLKAILENFIL